ncbi:MAG: tetratricopeptide repeat protein [Candidatus Lindowbacteria bacterium]|nr:tetratricopeptide repeat protein [Candidatus Lindowbacteria bacterium]
MRNSANAAQGGAQTVRRSMLMGGALLFSLAMLVYVNSFKNDFVGYDDQNLIQNNPATQSLAPENIARIFIPRMRGNYQPIRTLSYAVDYAVWGGRPFGFQLTNILLHAFTVLGVWLLIRSLSPEPVPFLTALIFAVHPIHAESVTWMSARKDVLSLAFFLLAILLYERKGDRWSYVASILLTGLALLSKLTAISLPLCIVLLEVCRDGWPKAGELVRKLVRLSPHLLIACLVLGLNFMHFGAVSSHGDALAPIEKTSSAMLHDIRVSMPLVICRYVGLLFVPYHLTTHYDVTQISEISDPRALVPICILIAGIISGVVCYLRGRTACAFGIGWFVITFLPTSNILPTAAMMNDRYMHTPSIGFALILAMALAYPARKISHTRESAARLIAFMPAILIVLLLSALTIRRNTDWRDTTSLFTRTLRFNSRSVDARLALGAMYDKAGDYNSAIEMFRDALAIEPDNYRVLYDLGVTYMKRGWLRQAADALEKSRAANPDYIPTRFNLALYYHREKRYDEAIAEHKAVLRILPTYATSHGDLGRIYLETEQLDLAMDELNQALRLQPGLVPALIDRVGLFIKIEHPEEAEQDLQRLESLGADTRELRAKTPRQAE